MILHKADSEMDVVMSGENLLKELDAFLDMATSQTAGESNSINLP